MDKTHSAILSLAKERDERRLRAEDAKKRRQAEAKDLAEKGKFGDSDFVGMIERYRGGVGGSKPHAHGEGRINVAVRKRPSSDRERSLHDHDSVTCCNPFVVVHHCRFKIDGITKVLDNTQFEFDHAFDEHSTHDEVYEATCANLIRFAVLRDGRSTVFAYGQTGSGKTFTMEGLQMRAATDMFTLARARAAEDREVIRVKCAHYELYGSQCLDLLNDRRVCAVREDGKGDIHVDGLHEEEAADEDDFMAILQRGASMRTTRCTEMNADSSRSHAIFQVTLSSGGKLSLIDLAGSERGQDTKNHDATRRSESAAINKSLLALKECIRALDPSSGCAHVPYRGSKLTMVLKDSFSENARTVMISCVSPAASSSDHTLNTLRYADRVKEKTITGASLAQVQPPPMPSVGLKSPKSPNRRILTNRTSINLTDKGLRAKSPHGGLANAARVSSGGSAVGGGVAGGIVGVKPQISIDLSERTKAMFKQSPGAGGAAGRRTSTAAGGGSAQKPARPTSGRIPNNSSLNSSVNSSSSQSRSLNSSSYSVDDVEIENTTSRFDVDHDDQVALSKRVSNFHEDEDEFENRPYDAALVPAVAPPSSGQKLKISNRQNQATARSSIGSIQSMKSYGSDGVPPPPPPPLPNVSLAVTALVDEEEALLGAHAKAVQKNFRLLTEESRLLNQVQGVVDYDIDEYTRALDRLLAEKIQIFVSLQTQLRAFRDHLRNEEMFAAGHDMSPSSTLVAGGERASISATGEDD